MKPYNIQRQPTIQLALSSFREARDNILVTVTFLGISLFSTKIIDNFYKLIEDKLDLYFLALFFLLIFFSIAVMLLETIVATLLLYGDDDDLSISRVLRFIFVVLFVTVVAIPSYIPIEYIIYFLPTTAAALAIFIRLGFKWQPLENINQILTYVLWLQVSLSGLCIVTFLFLYCAKKL
jgi:hypothetical protein